MCCHKTVQHHLQPGLRLPGGHGCLQCCNCGAVWTKGAIGFDVPLEYNNPETSGLAAVVQASVCAQSCTNRLVPLNISSSYLLFVVNADVSTCILNYAFIKYAAGAAGDRSAVSCYQIRCSFDHSSNAHEVQSEERDGILCQGRPAQSYHECMGSRMTCDFNQRLGLPSINRSQSSITEIRLVEGWHGPQPLTCWCQGM